MNTTTIEMVMNAVIETADVIDGNYMEAYGRFFSIDKCAVLHDVVSRAYNMSHPIFVSDRGDVLEGVDEKDWQKDILYGTFRAGGPEEPDMFMKTAAEDNRKKFYNYSKLVLGLSYGDGFAVYGEGEDNYQELLNNLMKYLVEKAKYSPAQFEQELAKA